MWEDPIVKEIHKVREEHAAKFNYDIDAMFQDLQEKELQSGMKYVSFDPKTLKSSAKRKIREYKPKKKLENAPL
jgi:hypothetical protein